METKPTPVPKPGTLEAPENAEWLLEQGEHPAHVALVVGRSIDSLEKLGRKYNRPALVAAVQDEVIYNRYRIRRAA